MQTEMLTATPEGLARAGALLRDGKLVAMPTETVYGLAGDARSDAAVAAIFRAKGRPAFNPLIVHVTSLSAAESIAHFDDRARVLARAFWPGALTMVLPLRATAGLSPLVTAGLGTVAIRVPAHPVAQALLAAFGGPLAAPSANASGRVSPTEAAHVLDGLGGRIDAIVDGGRCRVGVESTIIGLDGPARLLRPGGIAAEVIEALLDVSLEAPGKGVTAPGQLASHYAPQASLRLGATTPLPHEVWVGFGPDCKDAALNLSITADLPEAAASLFRVLRQADDLAGEGGAIAFAPIPDTGLGQAINDRLRRAAAPRP